MCIHMIVIINVIAVAMQRTDTIYLGGTLKRIKMSRLKKTLEKFRWTKSEFAEEKLRLYLQKKYHKIKVVDKSKVTKLIKKYSEYINQRRS